MNQTLPRHGGQLHAIARSFGIDASELLDVSANINPDGPPVSVLSAMQQYLTTPDALTSYPDMEERALRAAIADYVGCDPANILVGNGFVALLEAVVHAKSIRSCCVPVPAFNEYRRTLERCGVVMKSLALDQELDFAYSLPDLLTSGCDAILLANPQNPSGILTERGVLIDLVEKAAAKGIMVLLDEAFIDYTRAASLTSDVALYPNLVVFRSVTKFFGMPGLRVAYAAAHSKVQPLLASCMAPWSISTPASVGAIAALQDETFRATVVTRNEERKAILIKAIHHLQIGVYPGAANYLLLRFPKGADTSALWSRMVTRHRVVLRLCENFEGLATGHLRMAVLREQQNAVAAAALGAEWRPDIASGHARSISPNERIA